MNDAARPRLLIVMGANGAGKSTLYGQDPFAGRLPEDFFNLDEIAAEAGGPGGGSTP